MEEKIYDEGVDYHFLKAMGITVVKHQPWQLGLFHESLNGKFIWYPSKGTLMFEWKGPNDEPYSKKIGQSGDYLSIRKTSTEDVYGEIMNKVEEQEERRMGRSKQ